MKQLKPFLSVILVTVLAFSCQDQLQEEEIAPQAASLENMVQTNTRHGKYMLYKAEYITSGEGKEVGNVVYFNHRGNKQLDEDFVEDYSEDGTSDISYYVDNNRHSEDLSADITEAAIDRAMDTWDDATCSDLGMTKLPYDGRSTGFIAELFGYGGSYAYVADIVHAGWLPGEFFDMIIPGGSTGVLAVTFTLIYVDAEGNPTDMDGNGKADVAWREIYHNDAFTWNDGYTYDVETIALHEAGHGLSQNHFGTAFTTLKNGKLHFAPRAVMNAAYSQVQTEISGTDLAGHCSNWANWGK
ncbi:hypothetical protein [Pontibacter sp. HSC-36F09]|uniref:hypothetical protein n=1 Tax=Pontibacter sp. HSC-36F09 TaxID=2910966 RepID=UPI0020A0BC41|nr:hypothetical protein [Pontibacter sp. HSC-36F09]MCP2045385.1 hypothetical protein [Pontibacter sp. HSC-36F09]